MQDGAYTEDREGNLADIAPSYGLLNYVGWKPGRLW